MTLLFYHLLDHLIEYLFTISSKKKFQRDVVRFGGNQAKIRPLIDHGYTLNHHTKPLILPFKRLVINRSKLYHPSSTHKTYHNYKLNLHFCLTANKCIRINIFSQVCSYLSVFTSFDIYES